MVVRMRPLGMDFEGGGTVVRVKSGGLIMILLVMTLFVVCLQNYVNAVTEPAIRSSPMSKAGAVKSSAKEGVKSKVVADKSTGKEARNKSQR